MMYQIMKAQFQVHPTTQNTSCAVRIIGTKSLPKYASHPILQANLLE